MQTATIDLTDSTTHGLNEEQLAVLKTSVDQLETHLLYCVDDVRQGRWHKGSPLKAKAEVRLRNLLVRPQTCRWQNLLNNIMSI
jgi:hypothetical protein